MKLLLIGFSEQNANLLSFLIQQNFKGVQCTYVERNLTSDLRFALPTLGNHHSDAQGLIIDLGGVGMLSHQSEHKQMLSDFTKSYPTLLTTRTPIDVWQQSLSDVPQYLYVQSPYNKESILPELQKLIDKAQNFSYTPPATLDEKLPEIVVEVSKNATDASKVATGPLKQSLFDNTVISSPSNRPQAVVDNVLFKYFDQVYQSPMVKELAKLFYQEQPFILHTSRYEVLIAPEHNLAVSANIARVLDYLGVSKNHPEFAKSITIELLTPQECQEAVTRLMQSDAKKYGLNTLLWQIYQIILPDEIQTTAHNLQIKLKFMPNLAEIGDMPSYVQAIMASCLSAPKALAHLYALFSDVGRETINRLFLLAVLSKVADLDVVAILKPEDELMTDPNLTPNLSDKNDGVNKAGKTGFFKRLLSKLAF